MCYDSKAQVPFGPAKGEASGEDLKLTTSDGNKIAAYVAHAEKSNGTQIVIYPDIRGLHQFYKDLAIQFAKQGIDAITFDFYGRTAGAQTRDDSFDYRAHTPSLNLDNFFKDTEAALAYLRQGDGARRPTFTVGFCIGGSFSLETGTRDYGLAGVIGFYSGLARQFPGGTGPVLDDAVNIRVPVLDLFGGADQGIPPEQVQQLDENLDKANVEHEIVVYDGAPHSFFDRRMTEFTEASTDAWQRVLGFIEAHK